MTATGMAEKNSATEQLGAARDFLLRHRTDYDAAARDFRWPRPESFNFGIDWFDVISAEHPERPALTIAEEDGGVGSWTYGEMSGRSDQVAVWLRSLGVRRGDRIILMLGTRSSCGR